jgi:hypothetical protein
MERSIPPVEMIRVIPSEVSANNVKLLSRMFSRFDGVKNPGACRDKNPKTATKARITV